MIDLENLERVIPVYLSDASKIRLATNLANCQDNYHYFANGWEGPDEPLQGDGWNHFWLVDFEGNKRMVSGIVCSNSCDIDISNPSMRSRNILFAPVVALSSYEAQLRNERISEARIQTHLQAIKRQEKTELFYLPESVHTPECVVMLDDIRPQPLNTFLNGGSAKKLLFRLNNFGFYMFLMKLAIHFSRFGEKLDREMEPYSST